MGVTKGGKNVVNRQDVHAGNTAARVTCEYRSWHRPHGSPRAAYLSSPAVSPVGNNGSEQSEQVGGKKGAKGRSGLEMQSQHGTNAGSYDSGAGIYANRPVHVTHR